MFQSRLRNIGLTISLGAALVTSGCFFQSSDIGILHCDYENHTLDFDEESDLGYSAQDVFEAVLTSGQTTVTWHVDPEQTLPQDCNPGQVYNPVTEECADEPNANFDGELTWELSADEGDIYNRIANRDSEDSQYCDSSLHIGATLELETFGGELAESWAISTWATGEQGLRFQKEIAPGDFEGSLDFDIDSDPESLKLEGVITDENFDGTLYLRYQSEVEADNGVTDPASKLLLEWPALEEEVDDDGA